MGVGGCVCFGRSLQKQDGQAFASEVLLKVTFILVNILKII